MTDFFREVCMCACVYVNVWDTFIDNDRGLELIDSFVYVHIFYHMGHMKGKLTCQETEWHVSPISPEYLSTKTSTQTKKYGKKQSKTKQKKQTKNTLPNAFQ